MRHNPLAAGIELDAHGWVDVNALIEGVCKTGRFLNMQTLEEIVETDGKRRFDFNDDRTKIRANQGHSIEVDVQMEVCVPPDILYHGTAEKYRNIRCVPKTEQITTIKYYGRFCRNHLQVISHLIISLGAE